MNKNQKKTFIFFTLVLIFFTITLFTSSDPVEQLKSQFTSCNYEKAIELAEIILQNPNIKLNERRQAYIIKGISEYSSNRIAEARETFMELLLFDKNAKLDSKEISPKIVDFFNKIKKRELAEVFAKP